MIVRLATVHENAQVIPLLAKEGLGVVDRDADAETCDSLPLLRRGGESISRREGDSRTARKGQKKA